MFVMQEGSLRVVRSPAAAGRGLSGVDYSSEAQRGRPEVHEAAQATASSDPHALQLMKKRQRMMEAHDLGDEFGRRNRRSGGRGKVAGARG